MTGESEDDMSSISTGIQNLNIGTSVKATLLSIPSEIRIAIAEYLFQRENRSIAIDLRLPPHDENEQRETPPTYAFLLTCKTIHKDCADVPFKVNDISIHAPFYTFRNTITDVRQEGRDIGVRLMELADRAAALQCFREVKIFLGALPGLRRVRWMDLMASWMRVKDAIDRLDRNVPQVELLFNARLESKEIGMFSLMLASEEEDRVKFSHCQDVDGEELDLHEVEEERLKKILAMMNRTMGPR